VRIEQAQLQGARRLGNPGVDKRSSVGLIGRQTLTATNFAELRQWVTSSGGKVNLANAGLGSASHLCGLMLQRALKTNMTPVPYKGTAPAMTDLIGGQVDLMCEQATNAVPQIEGKKVKVYGVTSSKRLPLPALKDARTLAEAGLADFNVQVWHGLLPPAARRRQSWPSSILLCALR
jgi:tripartite-type tricarboxylate transporter receptor subunit TctC